MKKFLFVMLTAAMAMCFAACTGSEGNNAGGDNKTGDDKTITTEQVDANKTGTVDDMKAIIEKAKSEGANWSIDQWKDATRQILIGMKPMFEVMADLQKKTDDPEFQKKMQENPAEATKLLGEFQEKMKEFAPMENIMKDFEKAAEASENGKKVLNDDEFSKELKKELGLPEESF